ncbi:Uncharacterized protein SCF082_LOCUS25990, partial [Durusdinium trenchii]
VLRSHAGCWRFARLSRDPGRAGPLLRESAIMSGWGKGGSGSASGWKGRWNSKGNPKGGKGKLAEKRDFAKKVPWENRLSKWFLRPYVEQGGSPFSGGRGVAESSLLTSWHLSNVLDETCSEY